MGSNEKLEGVCLSHPLEGAGSQNLLVLQGVELFTKQDVAADGSREHPGLLASVGQLTADLQHPLVMRQLSKDGAEQRGLWEM